MSATEEGRESDSGSGLATSLNSKGGRIDHQRRAKASYEEMGERKGTSITKHEARRLLAASPDHDFIAALGAVLESYRCSGWLKINEAAKLAGLSARTLQRKLAAEKVTFSGLVERVRADLAAEMLSNTDMPLNEIAKELGYSAVSNFSRAFRSWTGTTPSEFRRSS